MSNNYKRVVQTIPTKSMEAKSRGGIIKDGWEWTDNSQDNFNKVRALFT